MTSIAATRTIRCKAVIMEFDSSSGSSLCDMILNRTMSYTVSLCIICIVTCGLRTKSLCLCVHVIQACTVQLPLVVIIMTLDIYGANRHE